jgi:hypothetical protein
MGLLLLTPPQVSANEVSRSAPMVAKVRSLASSVRPGAVALVEVEMKNVSQAPMVVAFDNVIRSYFFTTESNAGGSFQGSVEGGVRDPRKEGDRCPGDFPTFMLEPGQVLVQLVGVPIPKTLRGVATLHLILRALHILRPPQCLSAAALDLPATVVLKAGT